MRHINGRCSASNGSLHQMLNRCRFRALTFGSMTGEMRSTTSTVDRAVVYSSYGGRKFTTRTAMHQ